MSDQPNVGLGREPFPPEPMGTLQFDPRTERWACTPQTCAILGVPEGTAGLNMSRLLAALDASDRDGFAARVRRAVTDGLPFATLVRAHAATRPGRWVVLLGDPQQDTSGAVTAVHCRAVDVTARQTAALTEFAAEAIEDFMASRMAIEQAKGALMLGYGIDAGAAFSRLAWQSKQSNMKIRDIAAELVAALPVGRPAAAATRARLDELLGDLTERVRPGESPGDSPGEGRAAPLYEAGHGAVSVRARRVGGATVVEIFGDVDLATAPELERALAAVLRRASGPDPVVVDAGGVTHLGSIGVKLLVRFDRRCGRAGVPLLLVAPPDGPAASVLAEILPGLKVHRDLASALGTVDGQSPAGS